MNQRCAACSRCTKSVKKRKKILESVDEANAFSLCFDGSRFLDNRVPFSKSDDFSESRNRDPEF